MEPLEGLLQRKGKAPELVKVYKIESNWEQPTLSVTHLQAAIWMRYMGADGMMRDHMQVEGGDERIVFNRPQSNGDWQSTGRAVKHYHLLRDIVDGWLPVRDGWEVSEDGDSIRICGDGRATVFFMEHDAGRAFFDTKTSTLDLCSILKPII